MAKVNWKVASNRRVIGDWVELKSLEGVDARIRPRKYSQAGADEINAWAIQRQARLKRETVRELVDQSKGEAATRDDMIIDVLAAGDAELFKQAHYMTLMLRYGVAEYEFGDECGAPTDAWITAVLDDVILTGEILGVIKEFNSPLAGPTSDTSATSSSGSSKE